MVVASDVRLYREGLVKSLSAHEGIDIVGSAAGAAAAMALVVAESPDLLLIDMAMDASVPTVRELVDRAPTTRLLAFAVAGDESDVVEFAEAGVHGYVPRDGSLEYLMSAIRHVARGETLCSPRVAGDAFRRLAALSGELPPPPDAPHLTPREREVVELLGQGLSNKQIAKRLYLQVATVKNHVHNVLKKLDVSRRSEVSARLRRVRSRTRKGRNYSGKSQPLP